MIQDLSKSKIYKITNDYNDDIYIGSTCDTLIKRFQVSSHKQDSKRASYQHRPLYHELDQKLTVDVFFDNNFIRYVEINMIEKILI
jgi:hypothetical protein